VGRTLLSDAFELDFVFFTECRQTQKQLQGRRTEPALSEVEGGVRPAQAELFLHIAMCDNTHMATNLALDDLLIEEARRVGRHKTKREAVSAALAEYVKRRKQLRILDVFGTVDFDPKYDYKAERNRKRS